jgi:elongation factor Ts
MKNKKNVKDNLVGLVSKIGEKITLRRSAFIGNDKFLNFSYTHAAIKKNIGKLGVLLSIDTTKAKKDIINLGKQLAMQVASSSPLAIEKEGLDPNIMKKEKEIITEELKNSGKDIKIVEKIALGKLNKFIGENTLLNQEWIMEPKKKVKDVIKEFAGKDKFEIKEFLRFKTGEGL